jgi:hypothetical protein
MARGALARAAAPRRGLAGHGGIEGAQKGDDSKEVSVRIYSTWTVGTRISKKPNPISAPFLAAIPSLTRAGLTRKKFAAFFAFLACLKRSSFKTIKPPFFSSKAFRRIAQSKIRTKFGLSCF